MVSCAQRNGVSGVPLAVIDGRWAISGGQTADVFYQVRALPSLTPLIPTGGPTQILEKRSQGKEP